MKYITIKVKHILCFIIILSIGFLSFYTFYPDILYGIGKLYDRAGKHTIANGYYEKILKTDPSSPLAAFTTHRKFLNILSSKPLGFMTDMVYIDHDSSCKSSFNITKEDLEKINNQYEQVIQGSMNPNLKLKLQLDTALLNWFGGNYNRSIEILEEKNKAGDPTLLNFHRLFLSSIYLLTGDIEKIPSTIDKDHLEIYDQLENKAFSIISYYHLLKGNSFDIKPYEFTQYNSLSNEYKVYANLLNIEHALQNISEVLKRTSSSGDGQIQGKLTIDQKPLPYQILLLKEKYDNSMSTSLIGEDFISMAITDKHGIFSFTNIPQGEYKIVAYVPWPLIKEKIFHIQEGGAFTIKKDTIHHTNISFKQKLNIKKVDVSSDHTKISFDFDPIEGASFYVLEMGEVYKENNREDVAYTFHSDHFTNNQITIDVNKNRENKMSGLVWDNKGIVPHYVWGSFYHEGKYTYKITAHDEYGIIGDSFGIWSNEKYPTIWIPGSHYTKEDKLLLDRSYEKAIHGYKEVLKKDPNNIHALRVLSRIYSFGYKHNENINIKEAIFYTEKLQKLLPNDKDINNDLNELRNKMKN